MGVRVEWIYVKEKEIMMLLSRMRIEFNLVTGVKWWGDDYIRIKIGTFERAKAR